MPSRVEREDEKICHGPYPPPTETLAPLRPLFVLDVLPSPSPRTALPHGPVADRRREDDAALHYQLRGRCGACREGGRGRRQVRCHGTTRLCGIDGLAVGFAHGFTKRDGAPDDAGGAEIGLIGISLCGHGRSPQGFAGLRPLIDAVVSAEEKIHEGALRGAGLRRGLAWHVEILTGLAGGGEGVGVLDVGQDELKGGDRRERGE